MLRRYNWEKVKEKCQHYRRRQPESGELYKLVSQYQDPLLQSWEMQYQAEYGCLRDEVSKVLQCYLNCGLLEHGAARVYCDECKYSMLVAYSCKKRGVCPSCSAKRAVIFAEHIYDEVLEQQIPHRHIVFSTPKRLRPYFKYNRKLSGILFRAAWQSIKEQQQEVGEEPVVGLILTLQTAGEALNWHPHLHGVITDNNQLLLEESQLESVTKRFGELVLLGLAKEELITEEVMTQILTQEHSGFSVWIGEPFDDEESEKFVARYIERGALSLEKLSVQDDLVIYTTKEGKVHEYEALDFLALLTTHIPNNYESVTRYYGIYSSRVRGERAKRDRLLESKQGENELGLMPIEQEPPAPRASSTWAACIKRIYEINPLECPRCKSGMRIIAFVQDPKEISKIVKSLGIEKARAPPPLIRKSKIADEYQFIDELPDYDAF
jgi:hypothetical protein